MHSLPKNTGDARMTSDDIVKHIIDFETQNNKNDWLWFWGGGATESK